MEFRVLGPLEVHTGGGVRRLGSAKQRALLAALLVEPGKAVATERLIGVLWGEGPPPSARNSLQTYVARVRAALARWQVTGALTTHATGYVLAVDPGQVDAVCFERLLGDARECRDPAGAVTLLDEALALWRGPAFADLAGGDPGGGAGVRLDELWLAAIQARVDALLELGRYAEAVADLEAAVTAHPLRERPHEQLVRALAAAGRAAEALELSRRFRRRLADEVGLDPSPRLAALERDIRRQAAGVVPGAAGAPAAASPAGTGSRLPRPATTLVGRDDDLARLGAAMARARLVTVTGPGGVGKSRLALAHAAAAPDARWCELGPVGDGAAVAHAVAGAVGLTAPPGRSLDEQAVVEALRDRQLLLVLDGCEHLVDPVASLTDAVLRHCPQVVLLATSRERVGVDGEYMVPLAPLPVPPADVARADADAVPAVRLFVDRARAVRSGFALSGGNVRAVAEVCRRLDGLPLAIELAAARTSALDPGDLAARLDERFELIGAGRRAGEPRHRTLRAVVDWSYQLLDEAERQVFTRVSVFVGGFTLRQAEQVAGGGAVPAGQVAALIASLVDKSMVVAAHGDRSPRYTLLETLRAYGQERLAERGEADAVARTHATVMVGVAERAASMLQTGAEAEGVAWLDAEVDNLRSAHRWARQAGDAGCGLRLAAALHRYGYWRLHREVLEWAEAAVAAPGTAAHPALPGALAAAGVAAWMRGDLDAAEAHAQRGLAAAGPDRPAAALLHEVAGDVRVFRGRMADAVPCFAEAARLAEQAGDPQAAVFNLGGEALARAYGGDTRPALALATAVRDQASRGRNPSALGWALYVCGEVIGTDDPVRALALLADARQLAGSVRNEFIVGVADVSAASVRGRAGDPEEALRHFAALIERWNRSNNWTQQWVTLRNLVESLARLGVDEADEAAAVLHAAVTAVGAAAPSHGAEAARLRDVAATVRRRLGDEAYQAATARGRGLAAADVMPLATGTISRLLAGRVGSPPER